MSGHVTSDQNFGCICRSLIASVCSGSLLGKWADCGGSNDNDGAQNGQYPRSYIEYQLSVIICHELRGSTNGFHEKNRNFKDPHGPVVALMNRSTSRKGRGCSIHSHFSSPITDSMLDQTWRIVIVTMVPTLRYHEKKRCSKDSGKDSNEGVDANLVCEIWLYSAVVLHQKSNNACER